MSALRMVHGIFREPCVPAGGVPLPFIQPALFSSKLLMAMRIAGAAMVGKGISGHPVAFKLRWLESWIARRLMRQNRVRPAAGLVARDL